MIPAVRIRVRRNENAVREDFVFASQPAVRGVTRVRRDRDPVVEPVDEEAPDRHGGSHPAERAVRVKGRDDRNLGQRKGCNTDRRGHRLVQVQYVEAFARERTRNAPDGPWREDDVRQRPVCGHDDRAADGNDVRRRCVVAAEPRVENAREAAGRVVADDRARVDAVPAQRVGLELGVLDHRPPEGPRIGDDDAHLHAAEDRDVT